MKITIQIKTLKKEQFFENNKNRPRKKQRLYWWKLRNGQRQSYDGESLFFDWKLKLQIQMSYKYTFSTTKNLFKEYYKLGDRCRQKAFLLTLVLEQLILRQRKRDPNKKGGGGNEIKIVLFTRFRERKTQSGLKIFLQSVPRNWLGVDDSSFRWQER